MNLILQKYCQGRPQFFRRISRHMDGIQGCDQPQDPFVIGETGRAIEYEVSLTAPDAGRFVDLYPVGSNPFGINVGAGELLLGVRLAVRLWDQVDNKRWDFPLACGVRGRPRVASDAIQIELLEAVVLGLVPGELKRAAEYAIVKMGQAALDKLHIPKSFVGDPPLNVNVNVVALDISDDNLIVRANTDL